MTAANSTPPVDDPGSSVANLETIVSLSKRRGFIFPSSEIYGGINAVWDYGQLGVELKNNGDPLRVKPIVVDRLAKARA